MNNIIKKTTAVIGVLIVLLSLIATPVMAWAQLEDWKVGIDATPDGDFSGIRQMERLNQMQAYVFPSTDYNTSSIEPFDRFNAYMPISIPKYILYRTNTPIVSEAYLNSIMNLYSYHGEHSEANSVTAWLPISCEAVGNTTAYQLRYNISQSTTGDMATGTKEYWHGITYSYYDDTSDSATEVLHGFGIEPVSVNVSNVVYVTGKLTILSTEKGTTVTTQTVKNIDKYIIVSGSSPIYIDYTLDNTVDPTECDRVISKFEGEVMVRYGNNETTRMNYVEDLAPWLGNVVSYSDTNLAGFTTTIEGVSITDMYADMYYESLVLDGGSATPSATINVTENGTYNVKDYAYAIVNVPQQVAWSGMFDWLFDSMGALMGFEIAPGWTIGIVMTVVVGLAIAIWALKVFLGG